MSIGSSIISSYNSLKENLTVNCSVQYGESMDKHGIINMNVSEYDFLNYAMKNNIQVRCHDVKYKFFDKQDKLKEEEILLMFNVCNGVIIEYDISAYLDNVKTKITDKDMTNAVSTFTVTAKAEHIPSICFVMGLLFNNGSENIFLLAALRDIPETCTSSFLSKASKSDILISDFMGLVGCFFGFISISIRGPKLRDLRGDGDPPNETDLGDFNFKDP